MQKNNFGIGLRYRYPYHSGMVAQTLKVPNIGKIFKLLEKNEIFVYRPSGSLSPLYLPLLVVASRV